MPVTNRNIHRVIALIRRAMKDMPDPSVTLVGKKWQDPYLVLISCLLSLRTKDETTLPAAERLFKLASTPRGMAGLEVKAIEDAIYPVGFYRTKARTVRGVSRDILERFHGEVPRTLEDLMSFKGVGRKTANLVLIEGFHIPAMCVDTHVHRISNRFGYVKTRDPHQTEWALRKKLPKPYWTDYNALLVTWGQNICKPVSPLCSQCPVNHFCAREGVTKSR
ncbi:MAG TPA: endonuclease III [Candidatus Omnitrophota bacterium]|jgi:endonuclease-3|nr:endonuclease III [Candidatus Omnitrophota bacterium]HPN56927.1 endonuclease III [Candidatus Omnitrophota bacterium]